MGHTSEFDTFLDLHRNQLVSSGVPQLFWGTLYNKLINLVFDAGNVFQLIKLEYEETRNKNDPVWNLQALKDVSAKNPENIFLIDHAWTYRIDQVKTYLREYESLRVRLSNILGIDNKLPTDQLIEEVFENMWKVNNTYSLSNAENVEDRLPIWYINDEIGSAIVHSDTPNCRLIPFIYVYEQCSYSLLFPIIDIDEDDFITRDFAEGVTDPLQRKTLLLPWVPNSLEEVDENPGMPGTDYYLSGHVEETLPDLSNLINSENSHDTEKEKLRVYSEYNLICKYLTDERFELTEDPQNADILWYIQHFKDFRSLSETPNKYINQFPFEFVLTIKDLLCMVCRLYQKIYGITPTWLPVTYNLGSEIVNFASYFQHRERDELDNYWIVKPYNLARGMDIHITNNLDYILRLSTTGPKIVQKYITKPVLFHFPECGKVKFDIRYVILLKKVHPLEAFVYKEFFLRFANKAFELSEFDVYEKHFTVMNYTPNAVLKHMKCKEFKLDWEHQYPSYPWPTVEMKIAIMLKEILECATREKPPCGIAESPQSRALYAADIMLEWQENREMQPKILEINFMPDCARACDYYPDFYNNIFRLLFLNEESDHFLKL